jgi:hypothetical protein
MSIFNGVVRCDEAIQTGGVGKLDCFAEPVIGPATSGRTRWLAMMGWAGSGGNSVT